MSVQTPFQVEMALGVAAAAEREIPVTLRTLSAAPVGLRRDQEAGHPIRDHLAEARRGGTRLPESRRLAPRRRPCRMARPIALDRTTAARAIAVHRDGLVTPG